MVEHLRVFDLLLAGDQKDCRLSHPKHLHVVLQTKDQELKHKFKPKRHHPEVSYVKSALLPVKLDVTLQKKDFTSSSSCLLCVSLVVTSTRNG
jgi:hypothetical protein